MAQCDGALLLGLLGNARRASPSSLTAPRTFDAHATDLKGAVQREDLPLVWSRALLYARRVYRSYLPYACLMVLASSSCKERQVDNKGGAPTPSVSVATGAVASSGRPAGSPKDSAFDAQTSWIRSFVENFNRHDVAAIERGYAASAVYLELGTEGTESKGPGEIGADYKTTFDGFADVKLAVTRSWHIGDVVLVEFVEGGSGTSDPDGPPKPFSYVGASLLWFDANGHVTRNQTYYDELTMEVQLGYVKPPLSKVEVRPLREVPAFNGTWEQHRAKGSPEEARHITVREKLYQQLTASGEKDFLDMLTDDVELVAYDDPKDAKGKKAVSGVFQEWRSMFSDMKFASTNAWACEDFAIFEGTFTGKHTGAWGPFKPTQKTFTSHFIDVARITKDGKVDRLWTFANNEEILKHWGLGPKKD